MVVWWEEGEILPVTTTSPVRLARKTAQRLSFACFPTISYCRWCMLFLFSPHKNTSFLYWPVFLSPFIFQYIQMSRVIRWQVCLSIFVLTVPFLATHSSFFLESSITVTITTRVWCVSQRLATIYFLTIAVVSYRSSWYEQTRRTFCAALLFFRIFVLHSTAGTCLAGFLIFKMTMKK